MLLTTWAILAANFLLRQGWLGGLGQIIGSDFITLYSAGMIYRLNPADLYNFDVQHQMQQALIHPTTLPGLNPFISPPYVAYVYSLLTLLPLPWAFALWSILSLLCMILAIRWMSQLLPKTIGLSASQLLILAISFFPFTEGFQVGQNHALTLLLVAGILVLSRKDKWAAAGGLAGLLIYKPQLVLGFLIIWLVWRKLTALVAFVAVVGTWAGSFLLINGIAPFEAYLDSNQVVMLLPYVEGFPGYLIVTLYGLLATTLPQSLARFSQVASQGVFVLVGIYLAWLASRLRSPRHPLHAPLLALATIYPIAASPYVQLHDMLLLIPVFILWSMVSHSRIVLCAAVTIYLGAFFLPLVAALTGIAWMSLLSIGLLIMVAIWLHRETNLQTRILNP